MAENFPNLITDNFLVLAECFEKKIGCDANQINPLGIIEFLALFLNVDELKSK